MSKMKDKVSIRTQYCSYWFMSVDKFKPYRRFMFAFGKTLKYTLWLSFAAFWYHIYLLKKHEKPENGFLANEFFLDMARKADWAFYDLRILLTRPPIERLLQDRPPLPPGAAYPKTLILNMRGTLIYSEYRVFHFHLILLVWCWFRSLEASRSFSFPLTYGPLIRNRHLRRWRKWSTISPLSIYLSYRSLMTSLMLWTPTIKWSRPDLVEKPPC